jgi:hypothetical protein
MCNYQFGKGKICDPTQKWLDLNNLSHTLQVAYVEVQDDNYEHEVHHRQGTEHVGLIRELFVVDASLGTIVATIA